MKRRIFVVPGTEVNINRDKEPELIKANWPRMDRHIHTTPLSTPRQYHGSDLESELNEWVIASSDEDLEEGGGSDDIEGHGQGSCYEEDKEPALGEH